MFIERKRKGRKKVGSWPPNTIIVRLLSIQIAAQPQHIMYFDHGPYKLFIFQWKWSSSTDVQGQWNQCFPQASGPRQGNDFSLNKHKVCVCSEVSNDA